MIGQHYFNLKNFYDKIENERIIIKIKYYKKNEAAYLEMKPLNSPAI